VKALKSLLAEKVFVDPAALDTLIKRRLLTVGYYNRFDIFRLVVDQRANRPVTLIREESEVKRTLHNESQSVSEALFASSDSII